MGLNCLHVPKFSKASAEIPLSEIKNQLQAFGAEEILADLIVGEEERGRESDSWSWWQQMFEDYSQPLSIDYPSLNLMVVL